MVDPEAGLPGNPTHPSQLTTGISGKLGLFGSMELSLLQRGSFQVPAVGFFGECSIWVFPKIGVPPNHPFQ